MVAVVIVSGVSASGRKIRRDGMKHVTTCS